MFRISYLWSASWLLRQLVFLCFVLLATKNVLSQEFTWHETQTIYNQDISTSDLTNSQFGWAIAQYGDYVLVGAQGDRGRVGSDEEIGIDHYNESALGAGIGRAILYKRTGNQWDKVKEFFPSESKARHFGSAVAMSENLIAISAPVQYNGYLTASGGSLDLSFIFLYEKLAGQWSDEPVATLISTNEPAFGSSLSLSDDLLVVGSAELGHGRIHVYEKPLNGWTELRNPTATLSSTQPEGWQGLGSSVSIIGDTIVAAFDDIPDVLVFEKSGSQWQSGTESQRIALKSYFPKAIQQMGNPSFRISTDGQTVVVSDTSLISQSDEVIVTLEKSGSSWSVEQAIKVEDTYTTYAHRTVVDQDTMVVLAINGSMGYYAKESFYLYKKDSSGQWQFESKKVLGDVDFPGLFPSNQQMLLSSNELLVGFPFKTGTTSQSGALSVFEIASNSIGDATFTLLPDTYNRSDFDKFGSVIHLEDNTLFVGVPAEENHRGAVYVYEKDSWGEWRKQARLQPDDIKDWDRFGYAIDFDENTLAISAPNHKNNYDTARVYIYRKPLNGWANIDPQIIVTENQRPTTGTAEKFATTIALKNNKLAVSAPSHPNNFFYLYQLYASTASKLTKITTDIAGDALNLAWLEQDLTVSSSQSSPITLYSEIQNEWQPKINLEEHTSGYSRRRIIAGPSSWIFKIINNEIAVYKKASSSWNTGTHSQLISLPTSGYRTVLGGTFDGQQLVILEHVQDTVNGWPVGASYSLFSIYTLNNELWVLDSSFQSESIYQNDYGPGIQSFLNNFEADNLLAIQDETLLAARPSGNSPLGKFSGLIDNYEKKPVAEIGFSDMTKSLSDGVFRLNATTNSSANIQYSIAGGDVNVINLVGDFVEILSTGVVQISAKVVSTSEYAENEVVATLTVEKGVSTISNFSDTALSVGSSPYTLSATTNSDGAISYMPMGFVNSSGQFESGFDLVFGNKIYPSKKGTLFLRAIVQETDLYQATSAMILVTIY